MRLELQSSGSLALNRHQTLRVLDGVGSTLCVDTGTVWITQENDPRDLVLHAGECATLDHKGLTLIAALDPASLHYR